MVNINLPFFISLSRLFFFFFPFLFFLFLFLRSCVYIIMCFLSLFFLLPFGNMFYNILISQRISKKFDFFLKKESYIFACYYQMPYFCIRFREREQRWFDILAETV